MRNVSDSLMLFEVFGAGETLFLDCVLQIELLSSHINASCYEEKRTF